MLLSESYREQNKQLHEDPFYGISGHKWAKHVLSIATERKAFDILDYGCGKQTMQAALGFPIQNYDPCVPGLDARPEPADFVVCTDVLEHIEPQCVDSVIQDIYSLTKKIAYLVIANRPASKCLPDGRNAHLIQEGPEWWLPRLWAVGFRLSQFREVTKQGHQIAFMVLLER